MYEATFSEYLELTRRERDISDRRRKLHQAIDAGNPTELMLKLERSVSGERRALHREIDARRAQLWPPEPPPKNRRLAHARLAALWPRKRAHRQASPTPPHSHTINLRSPDNAHEQRRASAETPAAEPAPDPSPAVDAQTHHETRSKWVTDQLGDNWVEVTPGIYEYVDELPEPPLRVV
jgi:hypothetical protein